MLNTKMSIAFEKWQTTSAAEMKAHEMAMRRAMIHMISAKLSAAMGTWRVNAAM